MNPSEKATAQGAGHSVYFDTEWTRIRAMNADADNDAWRWFTHRYRSLVRVLLCRRLPHGLVDGALADFWAYLWQSRSVQRVDGSRSFRRFLFGIVHRYASAWLRDHNRLAASPLHAELIEQAEDQEEDLKAWALDGLRAAMQALRQRFPQDAWALERYYGVTSDGDAVRLSVSAIAAQMQKTTSAVQQHLSRGRARLRQLIATELRRTVDSPAEQQAEAELLFAQMVKRWPDLGS